MIIETNKNYNLNRGLVIKSTGSWYTVKHGQGELFECKIKGKFRIKGIKTTNPVAVGDIVDFEVIKDEITSEGQPLGVITHIEPRKNYIIRRSSNLSKESHILAANIDQAFLIVTINYPITTTTFIDRFLVTAEAYSIPVNIIFNKFDRYKTNDLKRLDKLVELYEGIGYKCFKTSVKEQLNIDQVIQSMKGKINVFAGHSGVGKSSIINAIDPRLNIKTKEISDYHKQGVHTTTHSEMYDVGNESYIIDTPGIRGFGMIDMEQEEISHYFPEMVEQFNQCQFDNCTHTHEPSCVIKEAVKEGKISISRYNSYIGLLNEDKGKHRT